MGPGALSAAVALFIVLVLNGTLWSQLYGVVKPRAITDWLFLGSFVVFQVAAYFFFLRLLSLPFVLKVVSALLIVIAAAASHFMGEYGAVIDVNMIRNVLQTDAAEARDLTTWALVTRVFALGVVPAGLILFTRIDWPAWKPLLRNNLKGSLVALAVVGLNFAAFSGAYFSIMREQKDVVLKSTPANVVMAATKLASALHAPLFGAGRAHRDRCAH